jgi:cytochrome c biogenesis protein CcmG, thiol:disulfide interchange protein DsbE
MGHAVPIPRRVGRMLSVALLPALMLLTLPAIAQGPASMVDKPAPPFVRTDLQNHPVDLTSYRDHVVLLNFWATWCAPCQIEIPQFVRWQSAYGAQGLQILGVSMEDDSAPALALTRRRHVNYPVLMGDAKLGRLYGGVLGLPVTFLIDRQGKIAAVYKGQTDLSVMEREIRRLLSAGGQ